MIAQTEVSKWIQDIVVQGGALGILGMFFIRILPNLVLKIVEGQNATQKAQTDERNARDERFTKTIDVIQAQQNDRNTKLELAISNQTNQLGTKLDTLGAKLEQHSESINKAVLSVCKAPK